MLPPPDGIGGYRGFGMVENNYISMDHVKFSKEAKRLFMWRSVLMLSVLLVANVVLLALAACFSSYEGSQEFFSLSLLSWTFGLRHAVDADHIAAIDNVTRKLVGQGQVPVSVGLMFGMGHSLMVVVISVITLFSAATLQRMEGPMADFGRIVGTLFSAFVLLLLSFVNLALFVSLLKATDADLVPVNPGDGDPEIPQGCLTRCLSGVFRMVDSPWKMFLLGLVFSLSFDTSTEVALLVLIAEKPAKQNWSALMALVLPLLFAAGMTLIDAADGVGMAWAYTYGEQRSHSRKFYNLLITGISAIVALFLGVLEVLQVIADRMDLNRGWFWKAVNNLDPGILGYGVLGLFGVVILAAVIYESVTACRRGNASSSSRLSGYTEEDALLRSRERSADRFYYTKDRECK